MATISQQHVDEVKKLAKARSARARKGNRWWIFVAIVVIAGLGAAGYFTWKQRSAAQVDAAQVVPLQTAQVRKGSITISTTGSGTLIAGRESTLAFSSAGTVGEVNSEVSDVVKAGQTLAKLADTSDLQAAVNSAKESLLTAQDDLETLKTSGAANLAAAQISLADAQKALTDAKSSAVQPGWTRCDQTTVDAYYAQYMHAKDQLDALGDGGGNQDYYLKIIVPARNIVARDYAAYVTCAGYTEYEIASSQASVALAEADLQTSQAALDQMQQNAGIAPLDLAKAQNKVDNAQLALDQAQEKLDGATLIAPFDGTILSVAGNAGDTVGTAAFIVLADMAHPRVAFSIDETDFSKVTIGEQATAKFDAFPDLTFTGKVIRVDPALSTSGGYQVATGLIEIDRSAETNPVLLPKGLNGTVELTQASAQDVLLVPIQAVRDLGDGTYSIFVLDANGKPKLRIVEVGLMDLASAEIKSGVSLGDVVTTGTTQTN